MVNFFSISRSGTHAIIYWIINQDYRLKEYTTPKRVKKQYFKINNICVFHNNIELGEKKQIEDGLKNIHSYELKELKLLKHLPNKVLLLRDGYNNLASLMKIRKFGLKVEEVNRWIEYAKEFAGETNILGNKTLINYNK